MNLRSLEIERWQIGHLNELRILGVAGGNTEYGSAFYVTFRSIVLFGARPTREEAIPFLDEMCRGDGSSMWELIVQSIDKQDQFFEECRKARNESAE